LSAAPSFALTIARLRVAFAEGTALRAHAWLTLLFIASRLLLYRAGLRMNLVLEWMWLADPTDLRERFWHTLFYFHAMPPGMNALTAVLLKLGGAEVATLALVVFATFSLVLANALFYLGRTLGLAPVVALCLALAFSLSPPPSTSITCTSTSRRWCPWSAFPRRSFSLHSALRRFGAGSASFCAARFWGSFAARFIGSGSPPSSRCLAIFRRVKPAARCSWPPLRRRFCSCLST